jgi:hypothetical protein
MKFVLVNGRTPNRFCALCCESIGESYLRDLSTRRSYCDHTCYLGHSRRSVSTQATREGLMTIVRVTNEPVPAARRARQLCDDCSGPFGMVTHRWWGRKFCKRRCKDAHIRDIMLDVRRILGWHDLLAGISLSRSAIPMVLRFAWNRSRGLRTLSCAVLILSFFAQVSSLEAWYCGRSFDFQAARIRWANARQSCPSAEDRDQICLAYGNQFYQAVEARQAVSQCEGEIERQKHIEILDAEIEAFNGLIATHCGT